MAANLGLAPGRLRPTLEKLAEQGYLTIEGKAAEYVYPTVAALKEQNPEMNEAEAKTMPRRLHR